MIQKNKDLLLKDLCERLPKTIPFNIWIDVRSDEDFEKVKSYLNDYEMVLVTSKTRSKFSMSLFRKGIFWDYGRHDGREIKIRPKYIMRIDVSDKHIIKDGYEYIK